MPSQAAIDKSNFSFLRAPIIANIKSYGYGMIPTSPLQIWPGARLCATFIIHFASASVVGLAHLRLFMAELHQSAAGSAPSITIIAKQSICQPDTR
ncbi:hypothetical protein CPB85DRAFT_1351767 [Mucidula mucida]|nr:hypothetical protein CPB85DRAFT_1351767 [Mucidula mucida]